MSTQSIGWAPSNRWFNPGFELAERIDLEEVTIRILPLPYFLASKLEAFFGRGISDLYASHDFEDILYLFNYSTRLVDQVLAENGEVLDYIRPSIKRIIEDSNIRAVIPAHLFPETAEERSALIIEKMNRLLSD